MKYGIFQPISWVVRKGLRMRYTALACLGVFLATGAAAHEVSFEQRKELYRSTYEGCFRSAKVSREYIELSRQRGVNAPKLFCECASKKLADGITLDEVRDYTTLGYMPKPMTARVHGYADQCMDELFVKKK